VHIAASFHTITRRDPTEQDVQIEILFCGICHSDLHSCAMNGASSCHCLPDCSGHEIVGRVTKVGSAVTKFKPGDLAAVGCLVDSDRTCPECRAGFEQFCPNLTLTFNSPDKHTGGSPMAATPIAWWSTRASSCAFRRTSTSPERLRCFALESQPTRPCATGVTKARKSRGRARRTGSHGCEVCPRAWSARCCLHDFSTKERGRSPPRRR